MMLDFANVDELVAYGREERRKGERFATRFILVQGCEAWDELIGRLNYEVDQIAYLSEFCSGVDVFPDMMRVQSCLKEGIPDGTTVLLLPLAECVRLNPDSGEFIRTLAEWPSYKIRRLYVPLLAAEEFFFAAMDRVSRYRQGLLPPSWRLRGEGGTEIVVAPFAGNAGNQEMVRGIKEYLSRWEQGSVRRIWLVTEMAPWLPERRVVGECRVRIYCSSFDYVYHSVGRVELREEWGSPEDWECVATQIQEGDDLDRVAARILNVANYDAEQLFSLWPSLDRRKQWLVWLWSKRKSDPGTYLYSALAKSRSLGDFVFNAVMAIFDLPRSVSFSRERKELLVRLGVGIMPAEFWERYHGLTDPLERVAVLTDITAAEREQLVLCVGELLERYPSEMWWEYLEVAFPRLIWYLRVASTGDEFVDAYFSAYNRCRLKDRPDDELISLVNRWAGQQVLWSYPPRGRVLAEERGLGAKLLWVDAMGIEWTGLLTHLLAKMPGVECRVKIARASLPTITETNREWEIGEHVVRGLDDIAHHYAYRFPDSYLKAMDVIEEVASRAQELLAQCSTVIITSDHGLSRFAATSGSRIGAPQGAEVETKGRYAVLPPDSHSGTNPAWIMEEGVIYLSTYDRFNGTSSFPGEVHSGATPEECLVPVIIVRKSVHEEELHFELVTPMVKLNTRGEGELIVRCNRKIDQLELNVLDRTLVGRETAPLTWGFHLKNVRAGDYTGQLYVGRRLVGQLNFKTARGIVLDDLGLGGV